MNGALFNLSFNVSLITLKLFRNKSSEQEEWKNKEREIDTFSQLYERCREQNQTMKFEIDEHKTQLKNLRESFVEKSSRLHVVEGLFYILYRYLYFQYNLDFYIK